MLDFLSHKTKILSNIDPDRIYVENIRSFFNMPYKLAKLLCEMAVRSRSFDKIYGVKCPGCSRIIMSVQNISDIPDVITCEICEGLEREEFFFKRDEMEIIEFYRLRR